MRGHNSRPAAKLSRAAMSFRAFHTAIAAEQLLAIAYVWWCAITSRRDRLLRIAVATLIGEKASSSPQTAETVRWADCKIVLATPCLCSSWYSRRAPQNGPYRPWVPSLLRGSSSCWYAVHATPVRR